MKSAGPRFSALFVDGPGAICLWVLIAAAARALVGVRTAVPSHDAAFYLWAAERTAAGEWPDAFRILFQPLYPLAVGACRWLTGAPIVVCGQLVSAGAATLAVVPLFLWSRFLGGRATAHLACAFYATGLWFCRHPAACASEGPFYLFVVGCAWCRWRNQPLRAGVLAGLALATRPEGVLLLLLGLGCGRGLAKMLLGFVPVAAVVSLGFYAAGKGLVPTSKAWFVLQDGVGGIAMQQGLLAALSGYGRNLIANIGVAFEAVGYLVLPLALIGAVSSRIRQGWLLWLVLVAQIALASLLRSHVRFASGFAVLLLPLAASGFRSLLASRGHLQSAIALLVVLAPDLIRLPAPINEKRRVLIELGAWLRPRLDATGRLATDLVRLEFFAGQRPWLPRRIGRAEFLQRCRAQTTRFIVFVPDRQQLRAEELTALGYRPLHPPARAPWLKVFGR